LTAVTRRKSNPAKTVAGKSPTGGGHFLAPNVGIQLRRPEQRKLPATGRDWQHRDETAFETSRSVDFLRRAAP
jgi:hypothetical protein